MNKVGIIGGGNMGAALIKGVSQGYTVSVAEKDQRRASFLRRRYGVATLPLHALIQKARTLLLAVKPQDMDETLGDLAPLLGPDHLVVSIAAGITTAYIEKRIGKKVRVVRAMPNLPLQIGEGITALCKGRYAKDADRDHAAKIFSHVGGTVCVREAEMDAVTAVSGSGPAYVFFFTESLIKAARSLGLNDKLSAALVHQTLAGSVALLGKSKEGPAELRARVTSKGGTTQAALNVFAKRGLDKIFKEALKAAKSRSRELAKK